MRFLGIFSVASLALCAAACDDGASASVNPGVNWRVGCASSGGGCSNYTYHDQKRSTDAMQDGFKVSCKVSGQSIEFEIEDPGYEDKKNTGMFQLPGSIKVVNGNAAANQCNVTVYDTTQAGFAPEKLQGTCIGSGSAANCILSGQFNVDGWDWKGSLLCTGLTKPNDPAHLYKLVGANIGGDVGVDIALDNCD